MLAAMTEGRRRDRSVLHRYLGSCQQYI